MTDIVLYHFWSPTCNPCKVIKPAIEQMKEEFEESIPLHNWIHINTHEDPEGTAKKLQISVVPTIVVTKKGQEIGRHSGASIGIYYTLIRKALKSP
jgi:thioredoxin 1